MKTLLTISLLTTFAIFGFSEHHEATKAKFGEVYKLIEEHLADSSEDTINAAAVRGLLESLAPHVQLNPTDEDIEESAPLITQTNRFYREFGYLRIANVADGLSVATLSAIQTMLSDGPLRGLVFDLRYAQGTDYHAAAKFAGLFADKKPVFIKAAGDEYHAAAGGDAILIPIMILSNGETAGSAEAAAAVMREIKAALIIGGTTAGKATVFEDFELSTGDTLRIATEPIRIGKDNSIPISGVSPDIEVQISAADEQKFFEDPYLVEDADQESTNEFSSRRVTEADLVRQRREGISLEQVISDRRNAPTNQVGIVTDPALARALDLLKALSVVENWKQD